MSASERKILALEDENRKLRETLAQVAGGAETLTMESGVNKNLDGFVTMRWGAEVTQLTPNQARGHAMAMLTCAEAAESDAAVMRGARALEFSEEAAFGLVQMIRDHRDGNETGR